LNNRPPAGICIVSLSLDRHESWVEEACRQEPALAMDTIHARQASPRAKKNSIPLGLVKVTKSTSVLRRGICLNSAMAALMMAAAKRGGIDINNNRAQKFPDRLRASDSSTNS
jgi:hypothetical protein